MNKAYIFLVITILLNSCSDTQSNGVYVSEKFSSPVQLTGERVFEEEVGLYFLDRVKDKWVLTTNGDMLFHVFDQDFNKIAAFGREGRGPNEFTPPIKIDDVFRRDSSESLVYVFNKNTRQIKKVNISESIENNQAVVNEINEIPSELAGALQIYRLNNIEYLGLFNDIFYNRLDEDRGYFVYDVTTENYQIRPLLNLHAEPYETTSEVNVNARWGVVSPDRSKLAVLLFYYPLLEIFDIENGEGKQIYLSAPPQNGKMFDSKGFRSREWFGYYRYLEATNSNLYLLKTGYQDKEEGKHPKVIQVITWDGKPVNQYLIPAEYNIAIIVADEDNNQFLGLSHINDAVYKFEY